MSNANAVRIATAGTYTFSGLKFINNTYDIENSSTGAVLIDRTNGADPTTFTNSNAVNTGLITINVNAAAGTFTRTSGDYTVNGFTNGMAITTSGFTNGGNNTTKIISTVTATVITVTSVTGLIDESGNADERVQAGSTTINPLSVNLTITVKDKDNVAIQTAQTAIYKTSDNTQLMNQDTDVNGVATAGFSFLVNTDIYIRVRKSSAAATKYIPASTTGTITSTGFSATITLAVDTNA